jgi:type VI secretion system protein ImpL
MLLLIAIIVAVLLTVGIWLAVWLAGLPLWVGIVVTVFAILLVVGVIVFRIVRANARAAALERELLKQASAQADQSRPERRAEILALQASMKAAIDALKRSKLGSRGGRSALYALPWYVIVGPPAAGKTTALAQSGLAFTSPAASGPKIKGTAGTKNCDWWFSKEAILLDTAGRFATGDDDRDEWMAFLDTVKRFRPERPLDGILVALSATDLVGANEAQLVDLAEKLRSRVDEVMNRLEMVVPIYLVLTKADLIAGFVEFWGDLGKQQRGQPWGATFALDDERLSEPAQACESEFNLLVDALHARLLERLPREQAPEQRARILQFPVEFQMLRAPLGHFAEELSRPNPYQETPILRGFYFTSGTQVGRPLDRVLANMARGFDLRLASAPGQAPQQSVSYFVTDLLRGIVFPDRNVAVRTTSRVRREAKRHILYGAAALLFTLIVLLPAVINFLNNVDLVRATSRDVSDVAQLDRTPAKSAAAMTDGLGALLDRVQVLDREKQRVRIPGIWGSQAAAALYDPVRGFYALHLRTIIEGPIRDQLRADVRAIGDSVRNDADNFQSSYDNLKLYLMMTNPDRLDRDFATAKLADKWARAAGLSANLDPDKLKGHAGYYVGALAADRTWAWPLEEAIVSRARAKLSRQPLEELQYGWFVGNAEGVPPILPQKIFYGPSSQFVSTRSNDVQVPGAYTAAGWDKIRGLLDSGNAHLVIEPWVLGTAPQGAGDAPQTSAERLREMYFQRYEHAWTDFLGGLIVQTPADIRTAIDELEALSEADGPYTRLFRAVSENSRLDTSPTTLTGKLLEKGTDMAKGAVDKVTGKDAEAPRDVSPVERHLRPIVRFGFGDSEGKGDGAPSGLSQYLVQINNLAVALRQVNESKTEPTTEFQAELSRTAAAVERLLGTLDAATRIRLEPLLMNPIRGSRAGVASSENSYLGDKWKAEVWETWNAKLAGRYPFAETAEEVTLPEFVEFFRPQSGALWKFYDKNLGDRLERSGNNFTPKGSAEPIPFRPDFLKCLSSAQQITDAIFGTGAEAAVPFSLKMQSVGPNVSEVTFRVDGQATVYRNEPERWLSTQWPGKGTPHGAVLQVKGAGFTDEIPRNGDFGLFRLLNAGGIKSVGGGGESVLSASWSLTRSGEPPVTIQFKPAKGVHPFARDFFTRLKCPPDVTLGGGAPNARAP